MTLLLTVLLFFAIALLVAAAGLKLWLRPKEAIERVTGATAAPAEEPPLHPSLMFH